jgi:hypothetical protein
MYLKNVVFIEDEDILQVMYSFYHENGIVQTIARNINTSDGKSEHYNQFIMLMFIGQLSCFVIRNMTSLSSKIELYMNRSSSWLVSCGIHSVPYLLGKGGEATMMVTRLYFFHMLSIFVEDYENDFDEKMFDFITMVSVICSIHVFYYV